MATDLWALDAPVLDFVIDQFEVKGERVDLRDEVILVTAVTRSGLERARAWPSPDRWPDGVAATLELLAELVDDADQRSLLRRAGALVGGALRDVAVGVATQRLS